MTEARIAKPKSISTDRAGCEAALFDWAESFDSKAGILGPMLVDYRSFLNKLWEDMAADEFARMVSSPHVLGSPLLMTQHFVGTSKWEKMSSDEIVGHHQMRVAHQKYTDPTLKTVAIKGHSHGSATIWYKRVDGVWKFAGLRPNERWFEYDYDKIFRNESEE
ncbi:hypothetical protein KVR01_001469 [Diaporthe batatas]|uniref:uncharacterized protein n=1 Tax=Diaporthe batatas TaxID=748121 RepID=UPI001D0402CE|nr:uncharacterized protein KVR01_001469 [Diaporthe batatas]KAG8168720.1 hypothetical protein KVR01_001469 [Diaporthe batatas]